MEPIHEDTQAATTLSEFTFLRIFFLLLDFISSMLDGNLMFLVFLSFTHRSLPE
jgi:hypothetical protein